MKHTEISQKTPIVSENLSPVLTKVSHFIFAPSPGF